MARASSSPMLAPLPRSCPFGALDRRSSSSAASRFSRAAPIALLAFPPDALRRFPMTTGEPYELLYLMGAGVRRDGCMTGVASRAPSTPRDAARAPPRAPPRPRLGGIVGCRYENATWL